MHRKRSREDVKDIHTPLTRSNSPSLNHANTLACRAQSAESGEAIHGAATPDEEVSFGHFLLNDIGVVLYVRIAQLIESACLSLCTHSGTIAHRGAQSADDGGRATYAQIYWHEHTQKAAMRRHAHAVLQQLKEDLTRAWEVARWHLPTLTEQSAHDTRVRAYVAQLMHSLGDALRKAGHMNSGTAVPQRASSSPSWLAGGCNTDRAASGERGSSSSSTALSRHSTCRETGINDSDTIRDTGYSAAASNDNYSNNLDHVAHGDTSNGNGTSNNGNSSCDNTNTHDKVNSKRSHTRSSSSSSSSSSAVVAVSSKPWLHRSSRLTLRHCRALLRVMESHGFVTAAAAASCGFVSSLYTNVPSASASSSSSSSPSPSPLALSSRRDGSTSAATSVAGTATATGPPNTRVVLRDGGGGLGEFYADERFEVEAASSYAYHTRRSMVIFVPTSLTDAETGGGGAREGHAAPPDRLAALPDAVGNRKPATTGNDREREGSMGRQPTQPCMSRHRSGVPVTARVKETRDEMSSARGGSDAGMPGHRCHPLPPRPPRGCPIELPKPHPHPEINTEVQLTEPRKRKTTLDEYRIFSHPKKSAACGADDFLVDEELLYRAYTVLRHHLDTFGSLRHVSPYVRVQIWHLMHKDSALFREIHACNAVAQTDSDERNGGTRDDAVGRVCDGAMLCAGRNARSGDVTDEQESSPMCGVAATHDDGSAQEQAGMDENGSQGEQERVVAEKPRWDMTNDARGDMTSATGSTHANHTECGIGVCPRGTDNARRGNKDEHEHEDASGERADGRRRGCAGVCKAPSAQRLGQREKEMLRRLRITLEVRQRALDVTRSAARATAQQISWYAQSAHWRDQALQTIASLEEGGDWYMMREVGRTRGLSCAAIFPNYASNEAVRVLALGVIKKFEQLQQTQHPHQHDHASSSSCAATAATTARTLHAFVSTVVMPFLTGDAPPVLSDGVGEAGTQKGCNVPHQTHHTPQGGHHSVSHRSHPRPHRHPQHTQRVPSGSSHAGRSLVSHATDESDGAGRAKALWHHRAQRRLRSLMNNRHSRGGGGHSAHGASREESCASPPSARGVEGRGAVQAKHNTTDCHPPSHVQEHGSRVDSNAMSNNSNSNSSSGHRDARIANNPSSPDSDHTGHSQGSRNAIVTCEESVNETTRDDECGAAARLNEHDSAEREHKPPDCTHGGGQRGRGERMGLHRKSECHRVYCFVHPPLVALIQCVAQLLELCALAHYSTAGIELFTRSFLLAHWEDEKGIMGYLLRREPMSMALVPLVGVLQVCRGLFAAQQKSAQDSALPVLIEARHLAEHSPLIDLRRKSHLYWSALSSVLGEDNCTEELKILTVVRRHHHDTAAEKAARGSGGVSQKLDGCYYTEASLERAPKVWPEDLQELVDEEQLYKNK